MTKNAREEMSSVNLSIGR